jgi:hypothetical protein
MTFPAFVPEGCAQHFTSKAQSTEFSVAAALLGHIHVAGQHEIDFPPMLQCRVGEIGGGQFEQALVRAAE